MNIGSFLNSQISTLERQGQNLIRQNVGGFAGNLLSSVLSFGASMISGTISGAGFGGGSVSRPYDVYIDGMKVPITPEKINVKAKNMNKIYNLVNGGEVNIIKAEGLKTITFRIIVPAHNYPFAQTSGVESVLSTIENLKESKKVFQLIVSRTGTNSNLWDSNYTVTLEHYTLDEQWEEGQDLPIDLEFREYRGVETMTISEIKTNETPHSESGTKFVENHKTVDKVVGQKKRLGKPKPRKHYKAKSRVKAVRKATGTNKLPHNVTMTPSKFTPNLPNHTMFEIKRKGGR